MAEQREPYDHPLLLVTPAMTGKRVSDAQWVLAGHNVFRGQSSPIATYSGAIDGIYGPETARATRRAKWWLGYAEQDVDSSFGQLIFNLLTGVSRNDADNAARRRVRIEQSKTSIKMKALQLAEGKIGTQEHPFGSNCQEFGSWYGFNCVAWCAIFCTWCIAHAGRSSWRYSFVPNIVSDAEMGRNGMTITRDPQPGDLVSYWVHGVAAAHVAFFHHWTDELHQAFVDLGGNTGPTDISNGGQVMKQTRSRLQVHKFIRLTF